MIIERNFKNSFLSFVKGYRNCNNIHRFDISNYELRENFDKFYEFGKIKCCSNFNYRLL